MIASILGRRVRTAGVVVCVFAAALVLGGAAAVAGRSGDHTLTVDFERTVSLYEGSKVRVLGVDVGTVEKLTPRGQTVRAQISWDEDVDVPADVKAVIVSPSVVGDRFVQLTPAYTGGAKLKDGTHLDQSRTGTPTELDETFAALDKVATTLGPDGLNKDGTVNDVLSSGAENLKGKGAEIRQSIEALAALGATAEGSKDEFFTSVEQIERFVSALEANDASVRRFNTSLAGVSDVLAAEGDDLQLAVRELAGALELVQGYVAENRGALRTNVKGLTKVTKSLSEQRRNLDKILQQGPKALSNLATAYNPTNGTLEARASIKGSEDRKMTVLTDKLYVAAYCSLTEGQDPKYARACEATGEIVQFLVDQARNTGERAGGTVTAAPAAPVAGASAVETLNYAMGVA